MVKIGRGRGRKPIKEVPTMITLPITRTAIAHYGRRGHQVPGAGSEQLHQAGLCQRLSSLHRVVREPGRHVAASCTYRCSGLPRAPGRHRVQDLDHLAAVVGHLCRASSNRRKVTDSRRSGTTPRCRATDDVGAGHRQTDRAPLDHGAAGIHRGQRPVGAWTLRNQRI